MSDRRSRSRPTRPAYGRKRCAVAVALLFAAACSGAEVLTYTLTPRPESGRLEVELVWQTGPRDASALSVSEQFGPLTDVPAQIGDLRVQGAGGGQRRGAAWLLRHRPNATVTCRYVVSTAGQPPAPSQWLRPVVTPTFFHGVGNAFLLVPHVGAGYPETYDVLLRWRLPAGWRGACSWGVGGVVSDRLSPADVRHSVYLAGALLTHRAALAGGGELTLAMVDAFAFDAARLADLAATLITDQCDFMRESRFPPFVITAMPAGRAVPGETTPIGGLGLYRSLALALPAETPITDTIEHLLAHEIFHYWNGRLLRPADPEDLVAWFTEGLTDYYALRLLHERGRWTADTLAVWLNRHLAAYVENPARNATNEEIRARRRGAAKTYGEVAYQRGLLLGLRWHRLARDRGVSDGLDRLFRELVERGRTTGLRASNDNVRSIGTRVLGAWFAEEFDRHVARGDTVELPEDALAPALRLERGVVPPRFVVPGAVAPKGE
ncbi:MAG: hypothetical protein IPM13_07725 [Phycisphaerales bacterium]|nr:hypothetical protein [Phycisphaerales bacterium]